MKVNPELESDNSQSNITATTATHNATVPNGNTTNGDAQSHASKSDMNGIKEADKKVVKNYRVRNSNWFCSTCDIYCNSQLQFDVHNLSQKHKLNQLTPEQREIIIQAQQQQQQQPSENKTEITVTSDQNNNTNSIEASLLSPSLGNYFHKLSPRENCL